MKLLEIRTEDKEIKRTHLLVMLTFFLRMTLEGLLPETISLNPLLCFTILINDGFLGMILIP
jgi:hypothetical protein